MKGVTTTQAEPAIRLRALRKEFGHVVAVDGIDLDVPAGAVYGYLGPNGAGKTTSLRMMLGLVRPTSGDVALFGRDPQTEGVTALDGVAGFVESPTFYPYLSGRRNLHLLAALDGGRHHERVEEVLEVVELDGRGDDKVGGYSQGMRQRLGLAGALLRRPRLLLLDEPTNGLDPGGHARHARARGHPRRRGPDRAALDPPDGGGRAAVQRAGRIARGQIRFAGTIADLRDAHRGADYRLSVTDPRRALAAGGDVPGVRLELEAATGQLRVRAEPEAAARLTVRLGESGVGIYAMLSDAPTLEELFFGLTEGAGVDR